MRPKVPDIESLEPNINPVDPTYRALRPTPAWLAHHEKVKGDTYPGGATSVAGVEMWHRTRHFTGVGMLNCSNELCKQTGEFLHRVMRGESVSVDPGFQGPEPEPADPLGLASLVAAAQGLSGRREVLEGAAQAVLQDRRAAYGAAEDNFMNIGQMWSTWLRLRGFISGAEELSRADVATMMILMKQARTLATPDHADSWTDTAGYAACGLDAARTDVAESQPAG